MDGVIAEVDLCSDRAGFLQRHDIMALLPMRIKKFIANPSPNAQIEGFEELFVLLEINPGASELRQLVKAYFAESPALRGHLSMSTHYQVLHSKVATSLALFQDPSDRRLK